MLDKQTGCLTWASCRCAASSSRARPTPDLSLLGHDATTSSRWLPGAQNPLVVQIGHRASGNRVTRIISRPQHLKTAFLEALLPTLGEDRCWFSPRRSIGPSVAEQLVRNRLPGYCAQGNLSQWRQATLDGCGGSCRSWSPRTLPRRIDTEHIHVISTICPTRLGYTPNQPNRARRKRTGRRIPCDVRRWGNVRGGRLLEGRRAAYAAG